MPKYNPSDEELSGYSDTPDVTAPKDSEPPESVDEEEAGEETALISNKILNPHNEPLKAGDEIVLQVVKNYGDESEVKYAPSKGGGEDEGEEPMSSDKMSAENESELSAMDQGEY